MTRFSKYNWQIFTRTRILSGALIGEYIVLHLYMCSILLLTNVHELGTFLNRSQSTGFFLFLLYAFLSYEFIYQEKACFMNECLVVNRGEHLKVLLNQTFLLFPFAFLNSAIVLAYDLTAVKLTGELTLMAARHLLLCCLLNILLVQVIGILLGAVLASGLKRPIAYGVLVVVAFLESPLSKDCFSLIPTSGDASQFDIVNIIDFFCITAPDTSWVPDTIYGLSIEMCRWALALFWIAFLLSVFFYLNMPKKWMKCKTAIVILCGIAFVGFVGFAQSGLDSVIRLDLRNSGAAYGDGIYGYSHENKVEEAGFKVLSYDLDLSVTRRLYATANMQVTRNQENDHYLFTLYRGYKITSIVDENGNTLEYTRDGHYLDIVYPLAESEGTISITYEGSGNRYYSNYQGIALPGYVPWYPMAGYLELWDYDTNRTYVNIDSSEKSFYVTIDTKLPVVSNLEQIDTNVFAGESTAVTLIGGLLTEKESDGIVYYDSPINQYELDLDELQDGLASAEEILGISFGLDFQNTQILCMPTIITSTSGGQSEHVVIMPDHILLSNDNLDLLYTMLEILIPQKENSTELRELFLYYLEEGETADPLYSETENTTTNGKPEYEELSELNQKENDDVDAWVLAQVRFEQLFRYQMDQFGGQEVLRACYDYFASDDEQNEIDFLYNLDIN